jgi:hypothetical protein
MIFRARDLEMIDDADKSSLFQNMTRRRWRGPEGEPYDSLAEIPIERPRVLRRAIEAVVDGGILMRNQIADLLAVPLAELEELAALDRGYLTGRSPDLVRLKDRDGVLGDSGNVIDFRRWK